jgi:hypothetical protein
MSCEARFAACMCLLGLGSACDEGTSARPERSNRGAGDHRGDGRTHGGYGKYKPSRFTFKPGPPGRAVGVHAEVELASGVHSTEEFEITLLPPHEDQTDATETQVAPPTSLGETTQALCSTHVGETPRAIGTVRGNVCWLSYSSSFGVLGGGGTLTTTLLMANEGMYTLRSKSLDSYFPPDLSVDETMSVGCVKSPEGNEVSVDYLEGLQTVSFSYSFSTPLTPVWSSLIELGAGTSLGFSVMLENGVRSVARGFQYDTGLSNMGIGLIPFPITLRIAADSSFASPPRLTSKFPAACASDEFPLAHHALAPLSQSEEPLRSAAVDLLAPILEQVMNAEGYGPGPNVMAGSNADALQSLGGDGFGDRCVECPPSSLDDLLADFSRGLEDVEKDADLARLGAQTASKMANVLPSPELLKASLKQALAGIQLLELAEEREALAASSSVRLGRGLIVVEGQVGTPVEFVYRLEELARLVELPEDRVRGATLVVDGSPLVDASEFVLEDTLVLSLTPKRSTPILIRAHVDLSTAEGPIPEELTNEDIELTPRLIRLKAGSPAHIGLTATSSVASGGSVTLNALVLDEHGNFVDEPVKVRFVDGDGREIGSAMSKRGVAALQYVPTPSEPVITSAQLVDLTLSDGEVTRGVYIAGSGFSADAQVFVDGNLLDEESAPRRVVSSREILVAHAALEGSSVRVVNPGGASSAQVAVTAVD